MTPRSTPLHPATPVQGRSSDPEALRLLTIREAAGYLGLRDDALRKWIQRGDGPPVLRLSTRRLRISMEALRRWIAARSGANVETS
ncbi:MAG: helix-turn-helix domain-containing protein [Planctomycetes bacterium]|nr:helix-turn-helix domain-containing protein [Planctomycetota bacterium]